MKLFPKNKGNVLFLAIATFVYMFSFESFAQNIEGIIPKPVSSKAFAGEFEIKPTTIIYVNKKLDGVVDVAEYSD